tara:strand:+ start:2184 stop:2882 length:699 start_codon:yes stop_codon:yes gene_type:complete
MSENNPNDTQEANGQSDIEKLQAKNGEIIGKNKELKEANTLFSDKITTMEATLKNLGTLIGVQDGEDITAKAQSMIKAKEQETFDKMSENEKLSHRLGEIEEALNSERSLKEKAEKDALGLRIDDRLKNTLGELGVKDQAKLNAGLTLFKSSNTIKGINQNNLVLDGGEASINDLVSGFLDGNKFLIDNPSKGGSGVKGGSVADSSALDFKNSIKNKDFAGAISQILTKQNS